MIGDTQRFLATGVSRNYKVKIENSKLSKQQTLGKTPVGDEWRVWRNNILFDVPPSEPSNTTECVKWHSFTFAKMHTQNIRGKCPKLKTSENVQSENVWRQNAH